MPYLPRSIRRRRFLLLLGTCLALSVWACRPDSQTPPDITIGLIAPLSGELAETVGQETVRGAKLAVSEVNGAGGLEVGDVRRQVVLAIADDRDSPDEAVAAATRLINEKNVVALVGLPLSRIAIPVADVAEGAGIPAVSSWSTHPQTTAGKKFVFRVAFTDDFQGRVIARFSRETLRANTAAVLYDIASDYNRGLAEIFRREFEAIDGRVVAFESYTTDERDFGGQLRQIRDSGAEVLFLPNYDNEVPRQAQQGRFHGSKTLNFPLAISRLLARISSVSPASLVSSITDPCPSLSRSLISILVLPSSMVISSGMSSSRSRFSPLPAVLPPAVLGISNPPAAGGVGLAAFFAPVPLVALRVLFSAMGYPFPWSWSIASVICTALLPLTTPGIPKNLGTRSMFMITWFWGPVFNRNTSSTSKFNMSCTE